MLKSMRLGDKIVLGFTLMIIILLVLGVVSLVNMGKIEKDVKQMNGESIPINNFATAIEEKTLFYMYELRGYGYTEEETYYTSGTNKYLVELREELANIRKVIELGGNYKFLKNVLIV